MTRVLIQKGNLDTEMHTGQKMPPNALGEGPGTDPSFTFKGCMALADTLILDLWPPELCDYNFLLS